LSELLFAAYTIDMDIIALRFICDVTVAFQIFPFS